MSRIQVVAILYLVNRYFARVGERDNFTVGGLGVKLFRIDAVSGLLVCSVVLSTPVLSGCETVQKGVETAGQAIGIYQQVQDASKTSAVADTQPADQTTPPIQNQPEIDVVFAAGKQRVETTPFENGFTQSVIEDFTTNAAEQENSLWCWAAACEMVLRYSGSFDPSVHTQEAIVERVKGLDAAGGLPNEAGQRREIMMALVPEFGRKLTDRTTAAVAAYFQNQRWDTLEIKPTAALMPYIKLNPRHQDPIVESISKDFMPAIVVMLWNEDPDAPAHAWVAHGVRYKSTGNAEMMDTGKEILSWFDESDKDLVDNNSEVDVSANDLTDLFSESFVKKYEVDSVLLYDPYHDSSKWYAIADIQARLVYIMTRRMAISAMRGEAQALSFN